MEPMCHLPPPNLNDSTLVLPTDESIDITRFGDNVKQRINKIAEEALPNREIRNEAMHQLSINFSLLRDNLRTMKERGDDPQMIYQTGTSWIERLEIQYRDRIKVYTKAKEADFPPRSFIEVSERRNQEIADRYAALSREYNADVRKL